MTDREWGPSMPGIAKLIEELGELQQVLGKALQLGKLGAHWDGQHLVEASQEEIADVRAALGFFESHNKLRRLERREAEKRVLFEQWHREGTMR